jgi:hypothetical protein
LTPRKQKSYRGDEDFESQYKPFFRTGLIVKFCTSLSKLIAFF